MAAIADGGTPGNEMLTVAMLTGRAYLESGKDSRKKNTFQN